MKFMTAIKTLLGMETPEEILLNASSKITQDYTRMIDRMRLQNTPWLDRIKAMNEFQTEAERKLNELNGVNETERWEEINSLREFTAGMIKSFRRCHMMEGRK